MKRAFVILAALALLPGCRPLSLMTVDPSGPPDYQLGWQDGCDSGISAEGDIFYKMTYGFKKRPEMAANDQYKQGWNEGFTYCRFAFAANKAGDSSNASFEGLGW